MYVRERSGISTRGGETGPKDARTRERPEEVERESGGGQGRAEVRRVGARGSVMRRQQQQQQVADTPSLLTRAVGSVMKLLRLAEFEILFVLFFIITFLLFKDLVSRLSVLIFWLMRLSVCSSASTSLGHQSSPVSCAKLRRYLLPSTVW